MDDNSSLSSSPTDSPIVSTKRPRELSPQEQDLLNKIITAREIIKKLSGDLHGRQLPKLKLLEDLSMICNNTKQLLQAYNDKYPSTFTHYEGKLSLINICYESIQYTLQQKNNSTEKSLESEEATSIIGQCQSLQSMFSTLSHNLGRQPHRRLRKSLEILLSDAYYIAGSTSSYLMATLYSKEEIKADNLDSASPRRQSIKVF